MEIIKLTEHNADVVVAKTLEVLKKGGLFVFPSETCYGLGADATNQAAIDKLYSYKTRREGKPLSVAVADMKMASEYVAINEIAANLYKNYLPGPITVISKGLGRLARGVESEYGTLGIRIPSLPIIIDIASRFGRPFTATSANASYLPKPYSVKALLKDTPKKSLELIDLIIDAGELPHRETSTVADTTMNNLNIMRSGQISLANQLAGRQSALEAKTGDAEATVNFGRMNMLKYIDEPLTGPLVFFLAGELGAGKTQFSKGLAKALGIQEIVKSPTFTILNEYDYHLGARNGKFIHIDTWRIDSLKDLETIGLDRYLTANNVIAIEWADKFFDDLKRRIEQAGGKIINAAFNYLDEDTRRIEIYE